jgi:hypothetical protein
VFSRRRTICPQYPVQKKFVRPIQLIQPPVQSQLKTIQEPDDIIIFVLSYNDSSFEIAKTEFSKYSWAKPLLLQNATENNPLYENIVYKNFDTIIKPLSKGFKYIGFLSYKARKKIHVESLNSYIIAKTYSKYDASFFWTGSLMNFNPHPNFQEIWRDCLEIKVGAAKTIKSCYGNFWCAKLSLMENYSKYLITTILPSLLKHPKIYTDAHYRNQMNESDLIKLASYPYHTHIPFILERVPNAWCTMNNLKICYSIR